MLRTAISLPIRLLGDNSPRQALPLAISKLSLRPFSSSESLSAKKRGSIVKQVQNLRKKKRYANPQAKRVAEVRTAKNVARQAVLREQRLVAMGDPVRGKPEPTAFVKSFDTAIDPVNEASIVASSTGAPNVADTDPQRKAAQIMGFSKTDLSAKDAPLPRYLNSFISATELDRALDASKRLAQPEPDVRPGAGDPTAEAKARRYHEEEHTTAEEAIKRILHVEGASSKHRTHINIQRCIDKFGRHNTDKVLMGGAVLSGSQSEGVQSSSSQQPAIGKASRIGADTGSSEVQIAILTAKIRRLADEYQGSARLDKVNKRNLRLLVHRRQKLLNYFLRKDRGGRRWQHLIETLGLTEATWKGEIAIQ